MRKIGVIITIAVAFMLTACNLVKIGPVQSLRGFYSYYSATAKEYPGLLVKADSTAICELEYPASPKVYLVNGQQMKECVANYDDAIVYIWDAHCPAEQCFSPSLLQKYCDEKNVQLFVVAEYYDGAELTQYYDIKRPLFGIDTQHYQSGFIEKYVGKFEADLSVDKTRSGRMLYFKKGKYVGAARIEFEE
jgi:hypothetical protein